MGVQWRELPREHRGVLVVYSPLLESYYSGRNDRSGREGAAIRWR